MPLKRTGDEPTVDTWGADFEMTSQDDVTLHCFVTRAALDQLHNGGGHITVDEQSAVFEQWRDLIEGAASQKYDCGELERGMVVVRPEDVMAARGRMQ